MKPVRHFLSVSVLSLAHAFSASFPELKPAAEDGGHLVIKWEMGDAAFVDLQRLAEGASSDQWETVLSTTCSTSFICPEGKASKFRYRLAKPLVWRISVVDDGHLVGRFSSLAFTQNGNPCISYEGDSPQCLKYAEFNGKKWQIRVVDRCKTGTTSLAHDREGNPAIAYFDGSNRDLKYAVRREGRWLASTVDHEGMVGEYASLAFSPDGNPGISYLDATNGDLKFAELRKDKWHTATLDSEGGGATFYL
jgi:hypothetical protein